jgi:hypothetical protein
MRGWETPALLVPLERANFSHGMETDTVSEMLCSLEYRMIVEIKKNL